MSILRLTAQEYAFTRYSVSEGLSSSTIYKLYQSKNGFLWIGTGAGVDRFDGRTFVNYSMEDGLPDTEVIDIAEDKKGRVWFISPNGRISYYHNGKIHIPEYYDSLFINNRITSFLQHSSGDYYIGTRDSGIYRFRGDTLFKKYPNPYKNLILRIFEDSSGIIWAETYFGFARLLSGRITDMPLKAGSFSSRVRAIPWSDKSIFS